ncbi:MAG: glycosyltransferase [Eubacterium sp.]
MKILQINSGCGYGSTGRIVTDLYDILNEKGHDCLIAYGRGTAPKGYQNYKIDTELEVKCHGLKTRLADSEGFGSKKATEKLIEKVKWYNPDVIHLHNLHGYYINIDVLFHYLANANKPVLWTLHDCWSFTGHCSHFDDIGCAKWRTGCHDCEQKEDYPASLFLDQSRKNYFKKKELFTSVKRMMIITPSNWLSGLVEESYLQNYPIKVIHTGINLDIFKPTSSDFKKKYHLENKKIILGVASVWSTSKGLDTFIKLAYILPSDYQIVLVGMTEKQIQTMPKQILGLKRTNSIKVLTDIYTAADLFINPTVQEVLGLVNLEALACGTPVITYNTGGSSECLDESCGQIVKKGELDGLVSAILGFKTIPIENCIRKSKEFEKKDKFSEYIKSYGEIQ